MRAPESAAMKCVTVLLAAISALLIGLASGGAARADDSTDEVQLGKQLFAQLKAQGEIVKSSPLSALRLASADRHGDH
jgi:hypothetical protein